MGSRTLLRVFLVICSLLLAVEGKQFITREAKKEKTIAVRDVDVQIDYEPVGCFKDRPGKRNRALERLKDFRKVLGKELWKNWPDMSLVIQRCAEEAFQNGDTLFAIQFYGECYSGSKAETNYKKYGPSKMCTYGVGQGLANYVYYITVQPIPVSAPSAAVCNVGGQTFKDGDSMEVYKGDLSSGECQQCTCKDGMLERCHHIFNCVLNDSSCNSYSMRPGQCCPTCERDVPDSAPKCTVGDRVYKEGESAEILKPLQDEKDRSECHQCTCTAGKMQDCHRIYYCDVQKMGCNKYVTAGQCCPTCARVIPKPDPPNCKVHGRYYKDGESMEVLNMSADKKTGQCDQCMCKSGKVEGCHHIFHCSLGSPDCASYKQVQGQCCPECVPVHPNPHAPSCQINGLLFKHGESAEVLHESADKKNIYCQQCECQAGKHTCYDKLYDCDIQKWPCEKSIKVPGQCCPMCACYNNGQQLGAGDQWQKLSGSDCLICTCQDDGTAKCRRVPGSCQ